MPPEHPADQPHSSDPDRTRCVPAADALSTRSQPPPAAPPAVAGNPELIFPRPFGGYELLAKIAEGGMGVVYKARQVKLDRLVAIKVIRPERLTHPDAVRRFLREAQTAARLSHPNIVLIHDCDQVDQTHYIVLEYVEGIDWQRLVKQAGPLPVGLACELVRQAACGLAHAHERGLVHRDIKPANLMVAPPPGAAPWPPRTLVVKLLDLGLARLHQPAELEAESILTQEGGVMGTPDYMAPEQVEDSRSVDGRADLYSLGCTLYYLLTAQAPFVGRTLMEKLDQHRWVAPPDVAQQRPDVPPALAAIVRQLLAKQPAERPQLAADLAAALEPFARIAPLSAPPVVMPRPPQSVSAPAGEASLQESLSRLQLRRSTAARPAAATTAPPVSRPRPDPAGVEFERLRQHSSSSSTAMP